MSRSTWRFRNSQRLPRNVLARISSTTENVLVSLGNNLSRYRTHKVNDGEFTDKLENNRLATELALAFCASQKSPTLAVALHDPQPGALFCSTEIFEGNPDVHDRDRITNRIILPYQYDREVVVELSTENFTATTGRYEQDHLARIAMIGAIRDVDERRVTLHPLILGIPYYDQENPRNDIDLETLLFQRCGMLRGFEWLGCSLFEVSIEQIAEFAKSREIQVVERDEWQAYMKATPEKAVKEKLCEILGEPSRKDWGGELADLTSAVHVKGEFVTAAFILKGLAEFKDMSLDLLGARADQIYRLAQTTARLLVVQHCHTISEAVRATLRAFAVTPYERRYFCLIDGKDTYRILKAYNKL